MKHKDTLLGTDYYVDGAIGTGTPGNSGDAGPANAASLYLPWGLAADSFGNIYVAENENSRVRRIDVSTGVITTFAGTGVRGYAGDGG
ncbi:MAG: hypothetical protein NTY38_28215, partial [Acidobacteria bacterium]|nr:hypothetical protein [Acidobacteriota bacterium]